MRKHLNTHTMQNMFKKFTENKENFQTEGQREREKDKENTIQILNIYCQ